MTCEVFTREEALALGEKRYFTGKACPKGHVTWRSVASYGCAECSRQKALEAHHADRDAQILRMRAYKNANREKVRASSAAWKERNEVQNKAGAQRWFEENADAVRARHLAYKRKRRAHFTALQMLRKATKLKATPPWIAEEHLAEIRALYEEARRRSKEGVPHHVDHIFPLKGENFTGLHVPWNLQVIPAAENLAKFNKFPEQFAEMAWS